MLELIGAIRSLMNGKAVGTDGVSAELLFKVTLRGDLALRRRLFDIVVCIFRGGAGGPQQNSGRNMPSLWYTTNKKVHTECGNYRCASLVAHTPARY